MNFHSNFWAIVCELGLKTWDSGCPGTRAVEACRSYFMFCHFQLQCSGGKTFFFFLLPRSKLELKTLEARKIWGNISYMLPLYSFSSRHLPVTFLGNRIVVSNSFWSELVWPFVWFGRWVILPKMEIIICKKLFVPRTSYLGVQLLASASSCIIVPIKNHK